MGSRAGRQQRPRGVWELPLAVPRKSQPLIVTIKPSENLLLALCSTGEGQWRERSRGPDVGPCPDGVWAPALTLHVQQFLRGILPEDREASPECCECSRWWKKREQMCP